MGWEKAAKGRVVSTPSGPGKGLGNQDGSSIGKQQYANRTMGPPKPDPAKPKNAGKRAV